MTDMIPAVKGTYFPPRNRAERKNSFSRTIAASFATDDDYVYSFEDHSKNSTIVPLSLSEMLAASVEVIHEEAEAPHAADPQLGYQAMASLDQASHRAEQLPSHIIDNEA